MKLTKIVIIGALSAAAMSPVWGICDDARLEFCDRRRQIGINAANGDYHLTCGAERGYVQCVVRCMEDSPGFDCWDDVLPFLSNAYGCHFTASEFC